MFLDGNLALHPRRIGARSGALWRGGDSTPRGWPVAADSLAVGVVGWRRGRIVGLGAYALGHSPSAYVVLGHGSADGTESTMYLRPTLLKPLLQYRATTKAVALTTNPPS